MRTIQLIMKFATGHKTYRKGRITTVIILVKEMNIITMKRRALYFSNDTYLNSKIIIKTGIRRSQKI